MNEGGNRVYYDASGYMLFEASGDSEYSQCEMEQDPSDAAAVASDDAESAAEVLSVHSDHGVHEGTDDYWQPMNYNVDDDGDENEKAPNEDEDDGGAGVAVKEEEGVVDQGWGKADQRRKKKKKTKKNKKGGFKEEPDVKAMSESERDKLFWDACLASS